MTSLRNPPCFLHGDGKHLPMLPEKSIQFIKVYSLQEHLHMSKNSPVGRSNKQKAIKQPIIDKNHMI